MCDPCWLPDAADGDAGSEAGPKTASEAGSGSSGAGRALLLFVDDTLCEHLDEEMRSAQNVVRFLFTRARRTQTADPTPP